MTSPSSRGGRNGLTATVVARDPVVRSSLAKTLRDCRIAYSESAADDLARGGARPDVVCTGPLAAAAVVGLDVPMVIVTRGVTVSDDLWVELVRRRPVVIRHVDLTPVTLLDGLLRARCGIGFDGDIPPSLSWVFGCNTMCWAPDTCVWDAGAINECRVTGAVPHCDEYPCEHQETLLDHPLIAPGPERTLVTPGGAIRLVWLEGSRFGAWQSCDGMLSHLFEELPDGTLRALDVRKFATEYRYDRWLATRLGVSPPSDAS